MIMPSVHVSGAGVRSLCLHHVTPSISTSTASYHLIHFGFELDQGTCSKQQPLLIKGGHVKP